MSGPIWVEGKHAGLPLVPGLEPFLAIKENGDGAVVMDLDQHVLLEATCLYLQSGATQELSERIHQRLSFLGWSSLSEAGTASLASTGHEGKLADYQYLPRHIQCREVELS